MSRFLTLGLAGSLLAHGAAYAALGNAPAASPVRTAPSSVEFEVAAPKPPPLPELPEPPRRPEPEPTPLQHGAPPVAPPPAPPPPAAPKTIDLSGVTLSNESGDAGWSSPSGDGSSRHGPLGPIGKAGKASHLPAPKAPPAPRPAAVAPPQRPALVASSDLSDKPHPPTLDAALRRHYPAEARMRAISGTASLRVRIDADGRVRSASLLSETFGGFGDACQKAVLGSTWSPPRDKDGRAVATLVRYTCRFKVD
jgi:TonB family protein